MPLQASLLGDQVVIKNGVQSEEGGCHPLGGREQEGTLHMFDCMYPSAFNLATSTVLYLHNSSTI